MQGAPRRARHSGHPRPVWAGAAVAAATPQFEFHEEDTMKNMQQIGSPAGKAALARRACERNLKLWIKAAGISRSAALQILSASPPR